MSDARFCAGLATGAGHRAGRGAECQYCDAVTPLSSRIEVKQVPHLRVCNCCGVEDGTIMQLMLGWDDGPKMGGSSSVSLCLTCRKLAAAALQATLAYAIAPIP